MFLKCLFEPAKAFKSLVEPNARMGVIVYSLLVLLLPPFFSWFGASHFGWRLGGSEPLFLSSSAELLFSLLYFVVLCIGFFGTVFISRWMAVTYGANSSFRLHLAFYTVVCLPLALASAAHLFPDVFFNVLILLPAFLWSIALLYRGLPIAFEIPPERGMLMSSSLVGWLLVAAVSLLGLSVGLWINGADSVFGL